MISSLALVLVATVAASLAALSGGGGTSLSADHVRADNPADLRYGFVDQTSGAQLDVQLNPLHLDAGKFTLGVPGAGLLISATPATITVAQDGSRHVTFSSAGTQDAAASIGRPLGYAFAGTGATSAATFSFTADVTADGVEATWSVTVSGNTTSYSSLRPAHTAEQTIQAATNALATKDWHTLYGYFFAGFQQEFPEAGFVTEMTGAFPAGKSITLDRILPGLTYGGEPGLGLHAAGAAVVLTLTDQTGSYKGVSTVELVLDAGQWRLTNMGEIAQPTVVSPANMHGWGFLQETATGTGSLVAGPLTPPLGAGSARFQLGATGGELLGTLAFAGTRLDDMQFLSYSTYIPSSSPSTVQAPSLQFDMDYDLTDTITNWQGRLVYEPYFTQTVTKGTWQAWDPLAGKWWATGNPGKTHCTQASTCTWAQVLQYWPNAGIRANVGGLEFKAGSGWPANFDGNVDAFVIVAGSDFTAQAFDFEATP